MNWLIFTVLSVMLIIFYNRIKPIEGLKYIDAKSFSFLLKDKPDDLKILDVRDQVDYYSGHIEGAINISLGRLPYIKKTEMSFDDEIIIISDSKYHSKKAARILKKDGYQNLMYLKNGMFAYLQFKNSHLKSSNLTMLNQKCV